LEIYPLTCALRSTWLRAITFAGYRSKYTASCCFTSAVFTGTGPPGGGPVGAGWLQENSMEAQAVSVMKIRKFLFI
jgi:hypothetical protein